MKQDCFSTYHPLVNFTFFTAVLVMSMFLLHPVLLTISLVCATVYSIQLNGKKALVFDCAMFPVIVIIAGMNALVNHYGTTILFYFLENPVTMESIVYGAVTGVMFVTVLIWFSCYNAVMTSDKFIFIFGKILPALSLILSMVLRLVPKYKAQIGRISQAQKCIGRDVSQGNIFKRIRNGLKITSILITWALENAIDTADSMKARGYGLRGRTAFSDYRFDRRDAAASAFLCAAFLVALIGVCLGAVTVYYQPMLYFQPLTPLSVAVFCCYFVFCAFPAVVHAYEGAKWNSLQSKI